MNKDQTRVSFPVGSRALAADVVESTRKSIGLAAIIDEAGRNVLITFDFLDRGDGGVVQILYQGDPTVRPEVTGSIRGAPEGLRMPALSDNLHFGDETDADDSSSQKGSFLFVAALFLFAYCSSTLFGFGYPLTVVLLTLLGEILVALLVASLIGTFFRRSFGNFWSKIRKGGVDS